MIQFLEDNDISVTKFLEGYQHELGEYSEDEDSESEYEEDYGNYLMSNDQNVEKNARKKKKKKNGKKSKKSLGGPNEDVVFVEFLEQTWIEGEIQQMPANFPITELWKVFIDEAAGRTSPDQVTIFDSVGFAIEDFAALRYLRDAVDGTDSASVRESRSRSLRNCYGGKSFSPKSQNPPTKSPSQKVDPTAMMNYTISSAEH